MRKSKSKNIKLGVIAVVVIALVVVGLSETSSLTTSDGSKIFSIPSPLAFSGQTSTNSNESIECRVKQTTYAIDSAGNTLEAVQSELLTGNPLLDLTDSQNRKMAGYVIDVKMFCNNAFSNTSDDFTLEVDPSTLHLVVDSQLPDTATKTTALKTMTTKALTFPSGASEKSLGYFSVYASDIEEDLPTSPAEYNSLTHFQVSGNLDINWKKYPAIEYKIPIKYGDIESWHKAKIVNDVAILDPELADPDGDGIINKYDQCDDQRETFNGYKDGDGCPDVNPDATGNGGTDTTTTPDTVTQSSCNAEGKTWYVNNGENGYCGTKYTSGSGTYCKVFDVSKQTCDGSATATSPDSVERNLAGKMLWQVDVKDNSGGNFAFVPQDDPSPFTFALPLDIVGGKNIGEKKQISEITAQALLKFNDFKQHKLVDTKKSNIVYTVWIGVGDKSNPTWIMLKEVPAKDFIPRNGASAEAGMSLGNVVFRASEIEGKIPTSLVPIGKFENLQIKVVASGTADIIFNDGGQLKPLTVKLVGVGASGDRDSDNNNFRWTNLVVSRGISSDGSGATSGNTGGGTGLTCQADENKITNKQTGESFCIKIGTTGNDSNPDPKIGEDGVLICTDDHSGAGGFPCTEDYRIAYCGGADSTDCGSPQEGDDITGNDGSIFDNDEFIVDNDGSETVSTPETNGDDVACTTNGVNTLSLADNACVIVTEKPDSQSDSNICIGTNCSNGTSDNSLLLIGVVVAVVGISAVLIKRAKQ